MKNWFNRKNRYLTKNQLQSYFLSRPVTYKTATIITITTSEAKAKITKNHHCK